MNTHFKIIIPVYNAEAYIKNALISVLNQDYENYDVYITDDCSTDNTVEVIQDFIYEYALEDIFSLKLNRTRQYALHNLHDMMQVECDDEDVFITLDGDDWLNGDYVLSKLDEIYREESCWLTYGSYQVYPGGGDSSFHVNEYPQDIIEAGDFKKDPQWRASHLRTFKAKLAKALTKEDLSDEDGGYYQMTWDQAMMFPMMEMARERIHFVSDTLYIYNDENPINDHKVDRQKQIDTGERIKTRHQKKDRMQ